MTTENEKVIDGTYGSPLPRMKGLSPYQMYPEREGYFEYETREKADGTRYRVRREVYRWGGSYSVGEWTPAT